MESQSKESKAGFRINAFQYLLIIASVATIVGLTFSSSQISQSASRELRLFTSTELAASSLIAAQRESLAYTTRFSQWMAGDIERRDVQIARALLAQRLSVVTSSNLSIGQQLSQRYFENLANSDKLLNRSQPGFLPRSLANEFKTDAKSFIDGMLLESRSLIAAYQVALNLVLEKSAMERQDNAKQALYFLFLFLGLSLILIGTFIYTLGRQYRRTSRVNMEQLRLISESISQLTEARSVVNQLELLDERKNIFISTVNHELRTPLTSIVGYIDILRDKLEGVSDDELAKIIDVLERNSNNLLNLVQDILSLTNLESGSTGLLKSEVDLKEVANDAILLLAPLSETQNVSVLLDVQDSSPTRIFANRNQFLEVLTNLLGNAIKFSKPGESVRVSIERISGQSAPEKLLLSVSDTGIGIPEVEQSEIFSSFFRASNARSSGISGTGLGLAIVSRIIEEHHGKITVESVINQGTTFRVEVPAYHSEIDEFIEARQEGVLGRAIEAIETCTISELRETCHEMVGALGFYNLEDLGREVSDFSAWLRDNTGVIESEIISRRRDLLVNLRGNLAELRVMREK